MMTLPLNFYAQSVVVAFTEEPVSPVAPKAKRRKTTNGPSARQVGRTFCYCGVVTDTVCRM